MKKQIPKFRNEEEEQKFWSENDSSEYLNWKDADRAAFPNLKPSTEVIAPPDPGEFAELAQQARKQAKLAGLKPKDIKSAVAKARKRK